MSSARTVLFNTASQVTGQVLGVAVSLLTFVVLARYLGAQAYGEYSIITTYIGFFAIAADWSLYLLIVKGLTGEQDGVKRTKLFGEHLAFRISVGLVSLILGAILVWFFPYSPLVKLGVGIGIIAFFSNSISQLIYAIFQSEEKLYLTAGLELLYKILLLLSVLVVGFFGWGLLEVVGGMIAAAAVTTLIGVKVGQQFVRFSWRDISIRRSEWLAIFHNSWALGLNALFSTVVFKIDILILSFYATTAAVGTYALAAKIIELLAIFSGAFVGSVFPIISRLRAERSERLGITIRRSGDFLLIMASYIAMVTFVLADPIVRLAGGQEFAGASAVLRVLALFPVFAFFGNYFYHLAVVFDRQQQIVWRTLAILLVNLVLNLILIPRYGFIAAAYVTIVTEVVGVILSGLIIYSAHRSAVVGYRSLGALILAGLVGAALTIFLNARGYGESFGSLSTGAQVGSLVAILLVSLVAYLGLAAVLGVAKKDDLALVLKK